MNARVVVGLPSAVWWASALSAFAAPRLSVPGAVVTMPVEVSPPAPETLSGTYWSAQLTNWPPWPYLPFPELPVYVVGDGSFVFDDREVDYVALEQEAIACRLLTEAQNS